MPPPNPDIDRWFIAEILPLEGALTRYIRRVWSKPTDVADLRQDIYIRVYRSALESGLPRLPKAFLFTTARNLLTDRIRRGRVIHIDYTQDLDSLNVLVDELSPEQRLSARQELAKLTEALDRLPARTREVIWLRRVEGLSQKDAAARLGMQEMTLAGYLSKGLRALARTVLGDDQEAKTGEEQARAEDEARKDIEP